MSVQGNNARPAQAKTSQNMFCVKDGRKYFEKSFKQLFRNNTPNTVLEVIKNEARCCRVQDMAESSGKTLLHLAAKRGSTEVATYLITNGCDVDARSGECGWTPLMFAAANGHADMCKLLLEANADIFATDFLGESALRTVTAWNKDDMDVSHRDVFLDKLKSLQLTNEELATNLIRANCSMYYIILLDNAKLTVVLRERGYTVPKSSLKDNVLLHDAVSLMNLENVKFVIERMDVDVNSMDSFEHSPMHYATQNGDTNGNFKIIKYLLDRGADINIRGVAGMTPLFSVFNGYMTNEHKKYCISFLLHHGADPQILDFNGDSVIDYAMDDTITDIDETVLDPVLSHLALQEVLGLPIIDKLREQIDEDESRKYYYKSCKRCLEDMKKIRVNGKVTLYNILTESEDKVLEYMRNTQTAVSFVHTVYDYNFYYKYVMRKRFIRVMDLIKKEKQKKSI